MAILTLTDEESLGPVVDHHETVVIDFWAPWCAPCKGFLPILEKAADRHPELAFCRVNTEEHKELAQAFDVESIPTLVVIRDRIMIASQPGMLPEDVLEDLIGKVKELDMDEVREEMAKTEEKKGAEL
jgi:thioredoxin 1